MAQGGDDAANRVSVAVIAAPPISPTSSLRGQTIVPLESEFRNPLLKQKGLVRKNISAIGSSMADHPLRVLRDYLQLSQKAMGAEIGVKQAHVANIENFQDNCGSNAALLAAELFPTEMEHLGITVEDLLRGEFGA